MSKHSEAQFARAAQIDKGIEGALRALNVFLKDYSFGVWLEQHDPKAREQAQQAVDSLGSLGYTLDSSTGFLKSVTSERRG